MAAKVHKTLRLDNDLVERVNALKNDSETLSNAMCRVIAVGCETLERGTDENTVVAQNVAQSDHDESTQRIIDLLAEDNARLTAEHEADRKAIAEKDEQIAAALAKAHDLAEQAHVLMGMAQKAEALPEPDEGGAAEAETIGAAPRPAPAKIGFLDWWKNYR